MSAWKNVCLAVVVLGASVCLAAGDVKNGKAKYTVFCVTCHGVEGNGDGPGAAALNPKPAKFTDTAYMSKLTDAHLVKVVTEGGAAVGKSPMMVSWKGALNTQEILDVVAYVRTLAPSAAPTKKAGKKN